MMSIVEVIAYIIIYIGCFIMFSAALGLYRFPDLFMRIHACSKVNSGGAITIFFGLILLNGLNMTSAKMCIILVLILILATIVSHSIARSTHIHRDEEIISVEISKEKRTNYFSILKWKKP